MLEKAQSKIIDYFTILKKHNRLATSYLFVGAPPTLLHQICRMLLCDAEPAYCGLCHNCGLNARNCHPDVLTLTPEGNSIKIEHIRQAQQFLSRKSFQAKCKVCVIENAHKLTLQAQNAFLKTLEEPPANSFILLNSARPDIIVPTIISRCRKIYLPQQEAVVCAPCEELATFLTEQKLYIGERTKLEELLRALIVLLRDYMVCGIFKDTNKLINKRNYEIIGTLNFTLDDAIEKLGGILKVYSAVHNININLACNLLKIQFS